MVTDNNETKNIGQLIIDTNLLSSPLKTISAYKPYYIFITAEEEGNVKYPEKRVLSTR
jgi:hypothetical protein